MADFARDLADSAITLDAPSDQFMRNSAAAPHSILAFMFWAQGFSSLLMLVHAAVNYSVFHGKVRPSSNHCKV